MTGDESKVTLIESVADCKDLVGVSLTWLPVCFFTPCLRRKVTTP
jgi:hypothetical protein